MPGLKMDFVVFDWKKEELIGIFLGMFVKIRVLKNSIALQSLFEFAVTIADNYKENPYHSFFHAADVAYMVFYLLEDMQISELAEIPPSDIVVLLVAALGHDVLHPGTNNLFQV
jgi:hypothetical protein